LKLYWLTTGHKILTSPSKSNSNQVLTSQASNKDFKHRLNQTTSNTWNICRKHDYS